MEYSFNVNYNENDMINYFKGASGFGIKDTLIVNIRNTGSRGWERFKGSFKCLENQSNLFFDDTLISEEVLPNNSIELVLNFSRTNKNKNSGNCFTTLQLIYKEQVYNNVTIKFNKNYDLFGNNLVNEGNVEKEEGEIDYFQPAKIKEEIQKEEKKDDEHSIIIKFRSAYQFSKADYTDDYIKGLLDKSNNDFQAAMMLHLDLEDQKKEKNKQDVKNKDGLDSLCKQFRKEYKLSPEDYSDDVIKKALVKKEGNFNNTFEELMSFIA